MSVDTYEEELKRRITNNEERFISYKKMLESVHRDKETFPPNEPWVIEHKNNLRDAKNSEESRLKELIEEKTYYPGISPTAWNRLMEAHKKTSALKTVLVVIENAKPHMNERMIGQSLELIAFIEAEIMTQ